MSNTLLRTAAVVIGLAGAHSLQGQSTDSVAFASLSGIVLDSIHNEPLAGAKVSISNSTRRATTGIDGRFHVDSIASGVHDITVSHAFPDSLGLILGARSVRFAPGHEERAAFAVPSERGLNLLFCGESGTQRNRTILTGLVTRVEAETPPANGAVELDWIEVGFQPGKGIIGQPQHLSAKTNAAGRFVFCSLPDSLDATIRAVSETDSSGRLTVSLGQKAVAIQYLFLPPPRTSATRADSAFQQFATVRGRVIEKTGRALQGATVDIVQGDASTSTGTAGEFQLVQAPMGSQLLRVRHIGYAESIEPIMVRRSNATPLEIELVKPVAALDPVVIRARLSDALDRSGFAQRARTGPGRYISGQYLADHRTRCVFDVIPFTGVQLRRGTSICSARLAPKNRGYSSSPFSGSGMTDRTTVVSGASIADPGTSLEECYDLIVDDIPEHPDLTDKTWQLAWLNPLSVVGIEVYAYRTAPMRFVENRGCGVILIWTSQYHGRRF